MRGALAHLNRAIEIKPSEKQYLILRSKIYRDLGDEEGLIHDLMALSNLDPEESQYIYTLSKIYVRQNDYRRAERVLESFVSENPDDFKAKQIWVDSVYIQNSRRGNSLLDRLIHEYPERSELKFQKIRLLIKDGNLQLAKMKLNKIAGLMNEDGSHLKAKAFLAEVLLNEGDKGDAIRLVFENLEENHQHFESLLVKSKYDFSMNDYERALTGVNAALRVEPESERALLLLAEIYLESGSMLLADDSYRQALNVNPRNSKAAVPVARKLIEMEDLERAENIIGRALDGNPGDVKLLMFYIKVHLLQKDWVAAKLASDRLQNISGAESQAYFFHGQIYQGLGHCDKATLSFQRALELNANMSPAIEGIYACNRDKKHFLISFLQKYKSENPGLVHGFSALAKIYQIEGEYQLAAEELQSAIVLSPGWIVGYANFAGLKNDMGDTASAIEIYKTGIKENPDSDYLKVLLASYYESISQYRNASQVYDQVVESHPDNLIALNNYVALLLDKEPSEENFKRALILAERLKRSDSPIFLDTYGWALARNNMNVRAEAVLRNAAEKAQRLVDIQFHFAVVLKSLGRIEESRVVFKRAEKLTKGRPLLKKKIALELHEIESLREER